MALIARRRPGTSPTFWRNYHHAQLRVAASSMQSAVSGIVRKPGIEEVIADFEKNEETGRKALYQRQKVLSPR